MTFITPGRIRALCASTNSEIAAAVAPVLDNGLAQYGVTSLLRRAHLMGQLAVESAQFTRLEESLYYSAARIAQVWPRLASRAQELAHNPVALANAAYANKIGNGDEASGDGWRFRGRGLIQLTGRANYADAAAKSSLAMLDNPDLAAEPDTAAQLALWFWQSRGCNEAADTDDVRYVTSKINPACEGLSLRSSFTAKAKTIFT